MPISPANLSSHIKEVSSHNLHWRYLYARRLRWHGVSTKQIITSQLFTVVASVAAGLILDVTKDGLVVLVGTLLMLPGIIDLAASITGAMCAKINHHADTSRAPAWLVALQAVLFALIVGLLAAVVIGVVGGVIGQLFFGADFKRLVVLAVVSVMVIGLLCYPLMALFTLLLRRLNLNPDNIAGPVESSVVDIVAVIVVAVTAWWLA